MASKYILEMEHGKRDPSLSTLFRLAAALGVSPLRLIRDIDRQYRAPASAPPPVMLLTKEMKRLRDWMEASPLMMWFADEHQKCLVVSRSLRNWMGLTMEDLQGDRWREAIHPEDREARAAITTRAFRHREPYLSHYRLRRADGQYVYILQTANPQFNSRGKFYGFVGTMTEDPKLEVPPPPPGILYFGPGTEFRPKPKKKSKD